MISCVFALLSLLPIIMEQPDAPQDPPAPPADLGRTLRVPLDHKANNLGQADLYYEFGAPYDPAKPVVFALADAQQFYLRKGSVAQLQQELFGDAFNVVGIVNRGATPAFIHAALDANGKPDWIKAWRIFQTDQYLDDIEAVRCALVGKRGQILLWGQSGGAMLVHQYLARYGAHVRRAFTAAAVNPFMEGELGLNSDRFWEEIGKDDPALQPLLLDALKRYAARRPALIMTLQRQNFFVPKERLSVERAALIRALAAGDDRRFEEAQKAYQVPEVSRFFDSPEGIPVRIREFEFFYPSGARERLKSGVLYPDLENTYNFAKPLVELCEAGKIPPPALDLPKLHTLRTEVFLLSGRWDHTVDYRSAIALAAAYPHHALFLADDDHEFFKMEKSGDSTRLLRAFLAFGLHSQALSAAQAGAAPYRWTEP
ncbi:MAG TPA: alpha/beta fold hydrolase [Chthonomonadaceae bacterium]|nr:alpha/beta fold hydrolase [Chthonomonadaceae bacterium]